MPRMEVDFSDVGGGFDTLEEGSYRAVIENITRGTSQRSGEPMLTWEYKVTEGNHKGSLVYDFTSLQKQALFRLKQRLASLGYEVPEGSLTFDTDDLVGIPVLLQVGEPRAYDDGSGNKQYRTNLIAVSVNSGEATEQPETGDAEIEQPVRTQPKKRPGQKAAAPENGEEEPAPWEKPKAQVTKPGTVQKPGGNVAKPRPGLKLERL